MTILATLAAVVLAVPTVTLPCEDTPPVTFWASYQNGFGSTVWIVQGSQTTNFCRDVTLSWTTRSNKLYSLQFSADLVTWDHRRIGRDDGFYWSGTGHEVTVRFGWPYGQGWFRVRED